MRFLVFVFVAVELLQVAVIAMLVVGYRNLQRKVEGDFRFAERPPRSVTED
ncbi:MAG TPA: hypothetical protein VF064_15535 [Pyrinomonadaceae bacterium]